MSKLAWRILAVLMEHCDAYGTWQGYLAGWTLGEQLGQSASEIQAARVLHGAAYTQNECERALRELVDKGLVEEMPNLGERWQLVVKGEQQ